MTSAPTDGQAAAGGDPYRALLAVSEAIVSHRDLPALFHELAGRLHQVVCFDYLALVLHDAAGDDAIAPAPSWRPPTTPRSRPPSLFFLSPDDPAGWVWQTQPPNGRHLEHEAEETRLAAVSGTGAAVWGRELLLASADHRPAADAKRSWCNSTGKEPSAYDGADLGFLQLVANQVAVAFENALAFRSRATFREIAAAQGQARQGEGLPGGGGGPCAEHHFGEIVGESGFRAPPGTQARRDRRYPTASTVLIRGETGNTGKEKLIARELPARAEFPRARGRTFVNLNCAAIPTGLLESELFGHERGAFTGAVSQKIGRFELAHRGTLFLDEVGDIPLELQPKLLRVLQEQEFERLGSTRTIKVDVRLAAATHRDLARMVADGRFREDLYYRLNVFPVVLPPLRERPDDIPRLVRHFTQGFARRMGRRIETIPAAVMDALVRYPWPGNVRELQNVIERAVILSPGPSLQVPLSDLQAATTQVPAPTTATVTLADAEREHILGVLGETGWVLGGPKGAAVRLGMKRSTLHWKMKKLGISRPE